MNASTVRAPAACHSPLSVDVLPASGAAPRRIGFRWGRHHVEDVSRAPAPAVPPADRTLDLTSAGLAEDALVVWAAPDAPTYHRRRRCAGLITARVAHDDALQAAIERMTQGAALASGRTPCGYCSIR